MHMRRKTKKILKNFLIIITIITVLIFLYYVYSNIQKKQILSVCEKDINNYIYSMLPKEYINNSDDLVPDSVINTMKNRVLIEFPSIYTNKEGSCDRLIEMKFNYLESEKNKNSLLIDCNTKILKTNYYKLKYNWATISVDVYQKGTGYGRTLLYGDKYSSLIFQPFEGEQTYRYELVKENGIWKISGL